MGNLPSNVRDRIERSNGTELNLKDLKLKKFNSSRILREKFFQNLQKVVLSGNELKVISVHKLKNKGILTPLKELDVSDNSLTLLPWEFYFLPNLNALIVANNKVAVFGGDLLYGEGQVLPSLKVLDLSNNFLQEFLPSNDDGVFISVYNGLQQINLSGNRFPSVPTKLLSFKNLKVLDLSHNLITTLGGSFHFPNLETLKLADNKLTAIEPVLFGSFGPKMLRLDLSQNQLTSVPSELFSANPHLQELKMSANKLSIIGEEIGLLKNLEVLELQENIIKSVSPAIGNCQQLTLINLQSNQLESIPPEICYCYKSLRKLYLNRNNLKTLPGEISFLNPSMVFEINNNPLNAPYSLWQTEGFIPLQDNLKPLTLAYGGNSSAEGEALRMSRANAGNSFTILAKDYQGNTRSTGGDIFMASVASKNFHEDLIVKDNKNGTYTVFYNIGSVGSYQMSVTCKGVHVKGSPFPLTIFA